MTSANGTGPEAAAASDRGGSRGALLVFFGIGVAGVFLGVLVLVAQLLAGGSGGTGEPGASPGSPGAGGAPTVPPAGEAAAATRGIVAGVLAQASLQVQEPQTPYRPGESPALIPVPRRVVQVILPDEPDGGYIVIYELPSAGEAESIGQDFRAYLASGTGAIQYPRDTQFVLRRVGSTLVFFPWSPEASTDARVPDIAAALETVGQPIPGG